MLKKSITPGQSVKIPSTERDILAVNSNNTDIISIIWHNPCRAYRICSIFESAYQVMTGQNLCHSKYDQSETP
jgi:citrate lyase alpha subunit